MMNYIRRALRRGDMTLEHVPGHPDERKVGLEWSDQDHGIYMADQLASGAWDLGRVPLSVAARVRIRKFEFEESLSGILEEPYWTWTLGGVPLLESIQSRAARARAARYLRNRDDLREEPGRPREWEGRTISFAAKTWGGEGEPGVSSRARSVRLLFDKQWDGRNEGKGKGDGSPLGCPLCGEPDGGDHWARQCGEQPLTKIRSKAEREIRAAAERTKRRRGTYAPSEMLKRIVDWVRDNLTSKDPGSFRLWCGLWPGAALDRWDQDISALTGGEPRRLGGLIKRMAAITTRAVSDLWETRKDLTDERRGMEEDRVRPDRAGSRRRRRRGERREPAGDH